jgi:hypothetical protein
MMRDVLFHHAQYEYAQYEQQCNHKERAVHQFGVAQGPARARGGAVGSP